MPFAFLRQKVESDSLADQGFGEFIQGDSLVMGLGECLRQIETVAADAAGVQVVDVSGGLLASHEVPQEALETVMQDAAGVRRTPDVIGPVGAAVHAAEEGVEARDMVHVQLGEEQVVDGLNLAEGQQRQTSLAAVEEQATDGLAAVDGHEQGVVPRRIAEYLEG